MDHIKYKEGFKYQLDEDYSVRVAIRPEKSVTNWYISLLETGVLVIRRGYAWDGPSGVTIDTPDFMRGSLVHDALYQLIRWGMIPPKSRLQADQELRRICREDGMCAIRAWWVYHAVRLFGKAASARCNRKKVIVAP